MKRLMILVTFAALAIGCRKDKWTYTVVAQNASAVPAQLKIDDEVYTVTQTGLKKEVFVEEFDLTSLSLSYEDAGKGLLTLSVYKDDKLITTVTGNIYMYVLLSRDSARAGGGGKYRRGGELSQGE